MASKVLYVFPISHCPQSYDRGSHLLLDRNRNIVGVLVGQPKDVVSWSCVHNDAFGILGDVASKLYFSDEERLHRRGFYPSIAHGISFGGGQCEPQYLKHRYMEREEEMEALMNKPSIQRICKFASSAFEAYGERNYNYMRETMEVVKDGNDKATNGKPSLRRPYDSNVGVFPCRSFNLGEQTVSYPHTDMENLAQSWCSITSLGNFDPTLGGHLVLWDFGLVIEFPASSTVLIPSALLLHSNTSIQPDESRFSIVQYAAGGLFRWVDNGCMTDENRLAQASVDDIIKHQSAQAQRWVKAQDMFTNLNELLDEE
ncbi:hypothetical protein F5887DRAFT_902786 [Amanita rubescens]|nr:hypothetical protein F5887DRAFT_902786 [Amanita rubescens]